jgi:di/tricarboxylate transporter
LWEVVILGDSTLNGVCLSTMNLHARFGIQVLGICRRGKRIVESLATLHLRIGDVLIIQGRRPDFERATSVLNCLPLADHSTKVNTARPWIRFGLFAAGVFCTTLGLLPPALAFTMVVMGLLTVGKFSGKDIMASMEWQVVILLGSLIPIGHAFASSGAAQYLTDYVMSGVKDLSMPYILAGLMIITMLLSDLMNNAATAIIMAPIGVALAHKYHAPIDPFLMTVAIGSSATFLTPIGHQSNLLVMAPGGYKFFDYARMGLWLDILLVMMAVPLIYWAWF